MVKCRPLVGQQFACPCWTNGEQMRLGNCWMPDAILFWWSVGWLVTSPKYTCTVCFQLTTNKQPTDNRLTANSQLTADTRLTNGQLKTNWWPTNGQKRTDLRPTNGEVLAKCWPLVGRQSTDSRPTYVGWSQNILLPCGYIKQWARLCQLHWHTSDEHSARRA